MPRLTNTAPPRLLAIEAIDIDGEGAVAVLTLDTDDGTMELAINRGLAVEIASLMLDFLAPAPGEHKTRRAPKKRE